MDEDFAYFRKTLLGQAENEPRWKQVVQATSRELGQAVGQLYVAKTFPPEAKARALAEVRDLMVALRDKLTTLDWMGAETRAAALDKLDHMNIKVGYPDQWRDYSRLGIKRQPYVLNVLAARAFEVERDLTEINQPVDRAEWNAPPQLTDAYYRPARNEIVFPAGILQPPFFSATADDAVNYGGIGAVIGHEMTHGFDDQGRQYDAQGILSGKSHHPGSGEVLGLLAMAFVVDACLLFACWYGGLLVRIMATLFGLVALLNTYAALRYALLNLL